MDNLIITGCGHWDYSVSAALLFHTLQSRADILKSSKHHLPQLLASCVEKEWTRIYILGISLLEDLDALCGSLKELDQRGVSCIWLSTLPLPDDVYRKIAEHMEVRVGGLCLTEAVADSFPDEDAGEYFDLLSDDHERSKPYHELADAAEYYSRNYQDGTANSKALRLISEFSDPALWAPEIKGMVSHYQRFGNREWVGTSAVMMRLRNQISQVASHPEAWVLIWGESGTGKETVAQNIHNASPLRDEPFIPFNCASVNPSLLESRFFGYEKGAFKGADLCRKGLFEQADGGTLFLDEIAELPLEAQSLLLRVLEDGRFMRLGGTREISVSVRLICATHRNLPALVREGKFRADLYYRISVIQLRIPPLREHKEDIRGLVRDWLWKHTPGKKVTDEQVAALQNYDFPGNVRELFNLLERASVMGESDFSHLLREHWKVSGVEEGRGGAVSSENLNTMIRLHVRRVYEAHGENLTKTAEALGVSRNTAKKYLSS